MKDSKANNGFIDIKQGEGKYAVFDKDFENKYKCNLKKLCGNKNANQVLAG